MQYKMEAKYYYLRGILGVSTQVKCQLLVTRLLYIAKLKIGVNIFMKVLFKLLQRYN